ncbi:UBX domain-containing protein 5 [Cladobotryum mycophilum]|uniref:UBX domain-containing protein 5 n=1 Tax=Cladobotryum mycophilum TaxID=491253 RepID=A0ABR0S928_9HYPO
MEENISLFVAVTDASPEVARGFLEITGGDTERALELFFENPDLVGAGVQSSTSSARLAPPQTNTGRQDSSGVIHISSDDEDADMQFDDGLDDEDDRAVAEQAAALAQEEEDAAMAKRLQEELYQESGSASNDVRAPIARTTETLVAPDPSWTGSGFETSLLDHMRPRRHPPRTAGPFGQRIWADATSSRPAASTSENGAHARRLEDLFRPPYDLIARISWDEARDLGKEEKKWIMVNLQDMSDFNCQMLNRDIWKDQAIKELVSENFIFLQYDKDYPASDEYITFYFPNREHENPENYPHVSIIDPRTGEQVKVWSGRPFPNSSDFHAELAGFLDRYSLAANSKNPVAQATARKPQVVDVDRMTEEEMLEMALKNSLAGGSQSAAASTPSVHDPDALTKASGAQEPEQAPESPFVRISSTNPHVEPDNNPATTTRIQFRHPSGRIIRRFNLQDQVYRIYEWLKAEPLEGKEGLEFELKKMPQGEDLMGSLDQTIEQTGLKQGTVMIEFITDE